MSRRAWRNAVGHKRGRATTAPTTDTHLIASGQPFTLSGAFGSLGNP
jgi:hypothetical protein